MCVDLATVVILVAAGLVIGITVDFILYARLQRKIDKDYTIELTSYGWDKTAKGAI